jgi:hypothetical protein
MKFSGSVGCETCALTALVLSGALDNDKLLGMPKNISQIYQDGGTGVLANPSQSQQPPASPVWCDVGIPEYVVSASIPLGWLWLSLGPLGNRLNKGHINKGVQGPPKGSKNVSLNLTEWKL